MSYLPPGTNDWRPSSSLRVGCLAGRPYDHARRVLTKSGGSANNAGGVGEEKGLYFGHHPYKEDK